MSAIRTFATANGWTENHWVTAAGSVNGRGVFTITRGVTTVTFRWDGTDADNIVIHHALAYPGGLTADQKEKPFDFATDSGNGTTSILALVSERRVANIGSGPYVKLTLMSDTSPHYVYCVLEYQSGKFRHFGFGDGLEEQIGNWTGGGFVAGQVWSGSGPSTPQLAAHTVLFDGAGSGTQSERATINVEGLGGQIAAEKFGVSTTGTSDPTGTDVSGNNYHGISGGIRATMFCRNFQQFVPDPLSGVIELTPALLMFKRRSSNQYQALGFLPGVRMCQLRNFNAAEEVVVGGTTWKFFPVTAKSNVGGSNEESENMGLAYKKVV